MEKIENEIFSNCASFSRKLVRTRSKYARSCHRELFYSILSNFDRVYAHSLVSHARREWFIWTSSNNFSSRRFKHYRYEPLVYLSAYRFRLDDIAVELNTDTRYNFFERSSNAFLFSCHSESLETFRSDSKAYLQYNATRPMIFMQISRILEKRNTIITSTTSWIFYIILHITCILCIFASLSFS